MTVISTPVKDKTGRMMAVGEYRSLHGIFVLNSDGTNLSQIAESLTREDSYPSLSSNGKDIVFGGKDGDIYLTDINNSQLVNLSKHPAFDRHPVWSPDGMKIAFESDRSGFFDLFVMNQGGADLVRVVNTPDEEILGGWSPDGKRIVFTSLIAPTGPEGVPVAPNYLIKIVDLASGSISILFREGQNGVSKPVAPVFSPNGSQIAFQGIVNGHMAVFTMDADGNNLRRLTGDQYSSSNPIWSPDGEQIVTFTSLAGTDNNNGVPAFFSLDGIFKREFTGLHVLITSWVEVSESLP